MKVREPVERPVDVVAAELLLSASQAFVVGILLYLAVGVWDERGVDAGSLAAVLVGLAFAVGGAWLYWLLGGDGLPLAAAQLPVALLVGASALLGLRGEQLLRLEPLPLVLTLGAALYGVVAGVFLDSPRRLRWDHGRQPRRSPPVPRITPTTAAWVARVRHPRDGHPAGGGRGTFGRHARADDVSRSSEAGPAAPAGADAAAPDATGDLARAADSVAPSAPGPGRGASVAAGESGAGATASAGSATVAAAITAPVHPSGAPAGVAGAAGRDAGSTASAADTADVPGEGVELPTSVEPRAQRSPWAWARPPEWTRDQEDLDDDRSGEGA